MDINELLKRLNMNQTEGQPQSTNPLPLDIEKIKENKLIAEPVSDEEMRRVMGKDKNPLEIEQIGPDNSLHSMNDSSEDNSTEMPDDTKEEESRPFGDDEGTFANLRKRLKNSSV